MKTAWYAAIVLMLCYTLSFVDRQILSLLVPFIKADLKINDTLVGLLQGFSFALFYAVMGLPLGRLADSANRRNLISIASRSGASSPRDAPWREATRRCSWPAWASVSARPA